MYDATRGVPTLLMKPYSPKCLEGEFSEVELPIYGVLRSSAKGGSANSTPKNGHLLWIIGHMGMDFRFLCLDT
jgi:hypothetical protein